jgi:hypothetical protein
MIRAAESNIRYLKEALATREDSVDTVPAIPQLITMNEKGLITYDSQTGASAKERAYVLGFLAEPKLTAFLKRMASTDCVTIVVTEVTTGSLPSEYDIPLTFSAGAVATHMSTWLPATEADRQRAVNKVPKYAKHVFVFDPVWGRPALTDKGLFTQICANL